MKLERIANLETLTCKVCGCDQLDLLYAGKDRLHGMPGDFGLYTCANCGVVTLCPQPSIDEIEKYYPDDYISYPVPIEQEKSRFKRIDRQYGVYKRRNKVEKYTSKKSGKILDIGCATGVFLKEMQDHGWDAYGVEPSTYAAEVAVSQPGLNIFNGYLDHANFEENSFDVITLWDVFEHLLDPVATLEIIKQILKPDGSLVITMPNTDSWERKFFRQYWAGWDVPRHYHIFSEDAIERLLKEHGMRIDNFISFTDMLGTVRFSLDFWLQESRFSEQTRQLIKRINYSSIFRLLLYPYMLTSNLFSKGTSMTIFASNDPLISK